MALICISEIMNILGENNIYSVDVEIATDEGFLNLLAKTYNNRNAYPCWEVELYKDGLPIDKELDLHIRIRINYKKRDGTLNKTDWFYLGGKEVLRTVGNIYHKGRVVDRVENYVKEF